MSVRTEARFVSALSRVEVMTSNMSNASLADGLREAADHIEDASEQLVPIAFDVHLAQENFWVITAIFEDMEA